MNRSIPSDLGSIYDISSNKKKHENFYVLLVTKHLFLVRPFIFYSSRFFLGKISRKIMDKQKKKKGLTTGLEPVAGLYD